MYNSNRSDYIVLNDFTKEFPLGVDTAVYTYKKEDVISLRDDKKKTMDLINKGLIKKIQ